MTRRDAFQKMAMGMGFALSAPLAMQLLQSCENSTRDFTALQFLTESEALLLEDIMEQILPETDNSPGAKSLEIIFPADILLNHLLTKEEQASFKSSLASFESKSKFRSLDGKQKNQAIKEYLVSDRDFFNTIKRMALIGYFTKEKVAKEYMNFNPLPGHFDPCVQVDENTKAWYD